MPSIFNPVANFACKIFGIKRSAEKILANQLKAAKRVNPPPRLSNEGFDFMDYISHRNDHISKLMDKRIGDGLWTCCHGHEQELIHWTGPYPFKHLTCRRCEHVLCSRCWTTAVLSPLIPGTSQHDIEPVRFGQICPGCGLSHRAHLVPSVDSPFPDGDVIFDYGMCACGRLADDQCLQFWIGPISDYRRNPHEAFAIFTHRRAESSVSSTRHRKANSPHRASLPMQHANVPWPLDLPPRPRASNSFSSSLSSRPSSRLSLPRAPWARSLSSSPHSSLATPLSSLPPPVASAASSAASSRVLLEHRPNLDVPDPTQSVSPSVSAAAGSTQQPGPMASTGLGEAQSCASLSRQRGESP